jgi:hypothetical protein
MSEFEDPRSHLDHDIAVGQVYTDSRSGEELTVLYENGVVLCRDEDDNHRMTPSKQFRQEVGGERYTLARNEDGSFAKDEKIRRLERFLDDLRSTDGRKASHKAAAIEEAIEMLEEEDLYGMDTVEFGSVDGIGESTAGRLRSNGFTTKGDIRDATDDSLLDVRGIGAGNLKNLRNHVN